MFQTAAQPRLLAGLTITLALAASSPAASHAGMSAGLSQSADPGARGGAAAAYDASTGEVVLFGGWLEDSRQAGNVGDTWRWDGTRWRRLDAAGPSARSWATATWDPTRQAVVLFGGKVGNAEGDIYGDTWQLAGDDWTRLEPEHSPPARAHHAAAWDSTRGRLVVFGGHDAAGSLGDLWQWREGSWQRIEAAGGPVPRAIHAMYDDPAAGGVVIHGGSSNWWPPLNLSDRWLVGDAGYELLSPAPARANHLAARSAGGVLVSGGWAFEAQTVTAAWLETTAGWQRLDDDGAPPPRAGAAWTSDPVSGRVFVYGGFDDDGAALDDFWMFDGEAWERLGH